MDNLIDNFPLSQITTLRIGGPAKKFIEVKTLEELQGALSWAKENSLETLLIGGGSNLLVSDEGVNKLVIKNSITGIKQTGTTLKVKTGTSLQDLVNYSIEHSLEGLQKLTGIPGTVGGAVYGNAGAYGQSISDHLREVQCLNPDTVISSEAGNLTIFSKEGCQFDYRTSIFKQNHLPILEVTFELTQGDQVKLKQEALETIKTREIKYPPGIKCPGSFFKNLVASRLPQEILDRIPPEKIVYGKVPAGTLMEEVNAKGLKKGDIEIASYHANLFINKGEGKARDFYDLAKEVVLKVKEKFGVSLEPEVQLVNLPSL